MNRASEVGLGRSDDDKPFSRPIYTDHEQAWERARLLQRRGVNVFAVSFFSVFPLIVMSNYFVENATDLLAYLISPGLYLVWVGVTYAASRGLNVELPKIDPLLDEPAPFLLLRSFSETELKSQPAEVIKMGNQRLRIEHNLAELLELRQCLGTMIVLQEEPPTKVSWSRSRWRNAESSPDLVVFREYDAYWFETIEHLVRRCRAIILLPGTTPGLSEEVRFLQSHRLFDRVLVLMPPLSRTWIRDPEEQRRRRTRWHDIRRTLERDHDWQLPDYEPEGMLYRPNPDLSVQEGLSLGPKLQGLNAALRRLSTVRDHDCLPLSRLLSELLTQGYVRESAKVFKRIAAGQGMAAREKD